MPTNDFVPFAADPAANVMLQSDYVAVGFTPRLLGFTTGTAASLQCNKPWRQSTMIASMIGQFTCDNSGQDMLDDGSPAGMTALQTHFTAAVTTVARNAVGVGYVHLTGDTMTGPLVINSANALSIVAPVGQWAASSYSRSAGFGAQIAAQTGSNTRWAVALADATPELGNNTGSNFSIARFADAGTFLDTPLSINRANGIVNFAHTPTVAGGDLPYLRLTGGTLTGGLQIIAAGINYANFGGDWHAFGWDGANGVVNAYVDNTWVGSIATRSYVAQQLGGYLSIYGGTLYGGLEVQANLLVDGWVGIRSSCWFANAGDFANFQGSGWRYRQWAGNWYDAWSGYDGRRLWATYGGASMQLDGGANLSISGQMRIYGGRLGVGDNGSISVYGSGTSQGMWAAGDGLWFGWADNAGNPTNGLMRLGNDGVLTVWPGIISYNWLQVSQWASVGGDLWVNGSIHDRQGRIMSESGQPSVGCNYGMAMGMFMNAFIGGGLVFGQLDYYGNPQNYCAFMNPNGTMAAGGFYSWSGRELKTNVKASPPFDSLAAVCRLQAYSYDKDDAHVDFGWIAEEVRELLPDAVEDIGPSPAISMASILAHLARAIAQLNAKVDAIH